MAQNLQLRPDALFVKGEYVPCYSSMANMSRASIRTDSLPPILGTSDLQKNSGQGSGLTHPTCTTTYQLQKRSATYFR